MFPTTSGGSSFTVALADEQGAGDDRAGQRDAAAGGEARPLRYQEFQNPSARPDPQPIQEPNLLKPLT